MTAWTRGAVFLVAAVAALGQDNSISSIESAIRAQQYDQAVAMAKTTLKRKPADFRVWTLEAIALSLKGDKADALAAFRKALAQAPDYPAALRGEAQLLFDAGDAAAAPLLKKIVAANAGDTTAQEMLAVLEARAGKCSSAVEHFRMSGDALYDHPESLQRLGACLMQEKAFEAAIPVFEKLLALFPKDSYARYNLALVQVLAKQDQSAIDTLQPLTGAASPDPDALSLASEAYEALGDTPNAVRLLRQAIVLRPADADGYVRFASLCLNHDSYQVGIDMVNSGLRHMPNEARLYMARGMLFSELANYDQAQADFAKAEKLSPLLDQSSYALGLTEVESGHLDQALATIRLELPRHPRDANLHYLLAKVLMAQSAEVGSAAFHQAREALLTAIRLDPDLVAARDLLASLYLKSGKNDLAIAQCRLALQTDPTDQPALYHLIMALRVYRQKDELPALVKRFAALQQASRTEYDQQKRYKLIEAKPLAESH